METGKALRRWWALAVLAALALLALAAPAGAKQGGGHLDRAFGKNGKLMLPAKLLGPNAQTPKGSFSFNDGPALGALSSGMETRLLPLPKGRFLLAHGFRIFRFEANGMPDRRFGTGGHVTVPSPAGEEFAPRGISLDPSGRILIAGEAMDAGATPQITPGIAAGEFYHQGPPPVRAAVLRLAANGNPDPSFGSGGFVESTFGFAPPTYEGRAYPTAVAQGLAVSVDVHGRTMLSGRFVSTATVCYPFSYLNYATKSFVAVLGTAGNLESVSSDPVASNAHYGVALATGPRGGTLFEGWQGRECVRGEPTGENTVGISMLDSAGATKAGFYPEALTFAAPPHPAVDSRGRTVLAGPVEDGAEEWTSSAMRLRANGTVDTSFGNGGRTALKQAPSEAGPVGIDADNRPVVGGRLGLGTAGWGGFSLTRLTAKGKVDRRFGAGGTANIFFRASEDGKPESVMVDVGGGVLVAGDLRLPRGAEEIGAIGIARYLPNG